jgi:hypothetical protein
MIGKGPKGISKGPSTGEKPKRPIARSASGLKARRQLEKRKTEDLEKNVSEYVGHSSTSPSSI